MKNVSREKFLTELMGECYHELDELGLCKHCKAHNFISNDFSTGEGYLKLLKFAKVQDFWADFFYTVEFRLNRCGYLRIFDVLTDPNSFANHLYFYLAGLGKKR